MSTLEKTVSEDQLHRFLFEQKDCRGELVTLSNSYRDVLKNGRYSADVEQRLGEFLAAACLLAATLKFEGILTLQARGDGPIPLLMAECNHQRGIRGIARTAESEEDNSALSGSLADLVGEGHLILTIDPTKGERYQGIIPLSKPTLQECLEDYFTLSEQLPTRFWISCDGKTATGMLLQRLPQQLASEEENKDYWQHVSTLAESVTPNEMVTLDHQTLLHRLYHQESVRLFDPKPLKFSCTCSRERTGQALKAMGAEEVTAMLSEQGNVNVDCQFCGTRYDFSLDDVGDIFKKSTLH